MKSVCHYFNHQPMKTSDTATVEMTLTPEMEQTFKEYFNLEIEMMQGITEHLPNGQTKFTIEVAPDKAELIKEFMLKVISQSHKSCLS